MVNCSKRRVRTVESARLTCTARQGVRNVRGAGMRTVFIEMFTGRGPCIHVLFDETGRIHSGFYL